MKYNLSTHTINTGHEFLNINKKIFLKHVSYKCNMANVWENLHIQSRNTKLTINYTINKYKHTPPLNVEDTFHTKLKYLNKTVENITISNRRINHYTHYTESADDRSKYKYSNFVFTSCILSC